MDKGFDFHPSPGSGHVAAMWNLNETRFSLEEGFEPMTFGDVEIQMTYAETEINIDQQCEKIHQPVVLLKHPDVGVNVHEGPAGPGESFLVEKHCSFEQKKNAEAFSSRNEKDQTKDD
ncbi:hypothetical protein CQW23_05691 [Capsicum baccatum]|uniref:Uncharacterized protein n=1 Tax=Capsicum baccatum TaxID=33114 RepID=A0A2G2XI95_CAPBA|nr:hypothetical protein CQW23_05691 [Capsicum baccatum]